MNQLAAGACCGRGLECWKTYWMDGLFFFYTEGCANYLKKKVSPLAREVSNYCSFLFVVLFVAISVSFGKALDNHYPFAGPGSSPAKAGRAGWLYGSRIIEEVCLNCLFKKTNGLVIHQLDTWCVCKSEVKMVDKLRSWFRNKWHVLNWKIRKDKKSIEKPWGLCGFAHCLKPWEPATPGYEPTSWPSSAGCAWEQKPSIAKCIAFLKKWKETDHNRLFKWN